jgi:hypothetical protein
MDLEAGKKEVSLSLADLDFACALIPIFRVLSFLECLGGFDQSGFG